MAVVPVGRQRDTGLILQAVRFYRAEQRQTRVTTFVQIPLAGLEPAGADAGGVLSYQVAVEIADSSGLRIAPTQSWRGHLPAGVDPEAYTIEMLDFAVTPGRYHLDVSVKDSVSGREMRSGLEISGLSDDAEVSDLLLSSQMRLAAGSDSVPGPGELRRGNTLITAAARPRLTPLRSRIFYLLEAYQAKDDTGSMVVTVTDSGGQVMQRSRPIPIQVTGGGAVLRGSLDLAGLPGGEYRLGVAVNLGGHSSERSGMFSMGSLAGALARDTAERSFRRTTDAGFFAEMDESQLDEAEAPLPYVAEGSELGVYKSGLSIAAKRQFLTAFWSKRDPTPGTPRNEERERFYGMIAFANTAFREAGRTQVPGWKTDRGRIFARNGAPTDTLTRRNAGTAPPYLVWKYQRGKLRYYVFLDRTGLGSYSLVYSNDLKEPGLPGWQELLGSEAVKDVGQFLNIDFFDPNRSNF